MKENPEDVLKEYLGYKVKDCVTEVEGIVTSICFDLYGCTQAALCFGLNSEEEPRASRWFDLNRLIIISTTPVMISPHNSHNSETHTTSIYNQGASNNPIYKN
jgi:hypothetical protein